MKYATWLKRLASTTLLVIASLWGANLYAVNMGKLTVDSKLDEPFSALITLNNVSDAELSTMVPKLASKAEFGRAKIARLPYLNNLRFEPVRNSDGQAQIRITSDRAISEPYVQFLVAVKWSGGKLLHEYTALLSPQEYASKSTAITTPSIAETVSAEDNAVEETVQRQSEELAATDTVTSNEMVFAGNQYGPVKRGDTLWGIASQIDRPAGVSFNEMMAAIVAANPNAFNNGNQDVLLLGSVLTIPDGASIGETVSSTTAIASSDAAAQTDSNITIEPAGLDQPADAELEGVAQNADGGSSSSATAETSGEPLLRIIGADIREYSAQDRISAEQIAAARQAFDPNDVSGAVQSLQTRIAVLEESILARDLENQELRERMRFLEDKFDRSARVLEEFQNAARVLELEQTDLALLQAQQPADIEVLGVNLDTEASVGTITDAAQDNAAAGTVAVQTESNVTPAIEEIIQDAEESTTVVEDSGGLTERVTATATTWWQRLSSNLAFDEQVKKLTLIGVILASLLGLMAIRRRRKADEIDIENMAAAAEEKQDTLSASALSLASGQIDKNIDPVAESKVYIAYGRQEEAEQVLIDALNKDPDHPELAMELLDVYQRGNDVHAFTELAADLKTRWPISQPDQWQRVVALGHEYLPGHELFEDDGLGGVGEDLGAELSSLTDSADANADADNGGAVAFSSKENRNPYLAIDNVSNAAVSTADKQVNLDSGGNGASGSDTQHGDLESNLADESTVQWDGVGTKINLAKAYIDMGDIENAKDLIEQAMKEGSDQQREQASALATQLAANLQ